VPTPPVPVIDDAARRESPPGRPAIVPALGKPIGQE